MSTSDRPDGLTWPPDARGHRQDGQCVFLGDGRRGGDAGGRGIGARPCPRQCPRLRQCRAMPSASPFYFLDPSALARTAPAMPSDAGRFRVQPRCRPVSGRRPAGVRSRGRAPRFPDPAAVRERAAAGMARQRRDHAEAAKRDRPDLQVLRGRELEHPPGGARAGRPRDRRVRGVPREGARRFLNASSVKDIIFVRGTTEGVNLVAQSWGRRHIGKGDEIVLTWLEHHSNIVPWQLLAAEKGAKIRVAPIDDDGQVLLDEFEKLLNPRTRLVSLAHVSNALGTVTPVAEMVAMAHRHGARVLVDGAQAVSHMPVDVQALDCDFYVFSGHKIFAPDRHRRRLRQTRGARAGAALAGRRQHDRGRHLREDDLPGHRRGASRPARAASPMPSASARPSTTCSSSAWRRSRGTSTT